MVARKRPPLKRATPLQPLRNTKPSTWSMIQSALTQIPASSKDGVSESAVTKYIAQTFHVQPSAHFSRLFGRALKTHAQKGALSRKGNLLRLTPASGRTSRKEPQHVSPLSRSPGRQNRLKSVDTPTTRNYTNKTTSAAKPQVEVSKQKNVAETKQPGQVQRPKRGEPKPSKSASTSASSSRQPRNLRSSRSTPAASATKKSSRKQSNRQAKDERKPTRKNLGKRVSSQAPSSSRRGKR